MSVNRYEDLVVWKQADEFKSRIFALIAASPGARRSYKFVEQLESSCAGPPKHITEGFLRFNPGEFSRFLDYAVSSVGEAQEWVRDGIQRGYFAPDDCAPIFQLARQLSKGIIRLKAAQIRFIEKQKNRSE